MRVLIAADHALLRRGLRDTIREAFPNVTVGEAETRREVLECARRRDWDIAIVDLGMSGRSGLDILTDLKRLRPKLPVLFLSVNCQYEQAWRFLKAGAVGYLTKWSTPDQLKSAVRRALSGGSYVSVSAAEKLALDSTKGTSPPLHELLSDREFQVLRMIAQGKTVTAIAAELSLSVRTISTYRTRILEKTGMKTTAELIRYALKAQIVD